MRHFMAKSASLTAFLLALFLILPGRPVAKVTGQCANCHTMHNSQNGTDVVSGGPYGTLLVGNCVGCHTGTNTGGTTDTGATPYVMGTSAPTFGTDTLAGGNFWWVENVTDAKGHNVVTANDDGVLTSAPGVSTGSSCGTDSCHDNLNRVPSAESGKNGCQSCHLNVMHHANDGTGTKYVDTAAKGWYRFLSGHMGGAGIGVKGIEDSGWGYGATVGGTNHNEYLGNAAAKTSSGGFSACGNTTTGFCTGCHGNFHIENDSADGSGNWSRHPSDAVIPNSGEYASISTNYNPNVPVARPAGFTWADGSSSSATPGTDMVMCLSCHVAHGSPYDDLLRWDYSAMNAGGGDNNTGCFVCHTNKDDA
ncbi:MAG: cytochrome c3 family protein [Pseudomonadota bacterium]